MVTRAVDVLGGFCELGSIGERGLRRRRGLVRLGRGLGCKHRRRQEVDVDELPREAVHVGGAGGLRRAGLEVMRTGQHVDGLGQGRRAGRVAVDDDLRAGGGRHVEVGGLPHEHGDVLVGVGAIVGAARVAGVLAEVVERLEQVPGFLVREREVPENRRLFEERVSLREREARALEVARLHPRDAFFEAGLGLALHRIVGPRRRRHRRGDPRCHHPPYDTSAHGPIFLSRITRLGQGARVRSSF